MRVEKCCCIWKSMEANVKWYSVTMFLAYHWVCFPLSTLHYNTQHRQNRTLAATLLYYARSVIESELAASLSLSPLFSVLNLGDLAPDWLFTQQSPRDLKRVLLSLYSLPLRAFFSVPVSPILKTLPVPNAGLFYFTILFILLLFWYTSSSVVPQFGPLLSWP